MLYSSCRFLLCLGSLIIFSTVTFAGDEKETQDYCADKFKDAGTAIVANCYKITNDTAANCTLYLSADQGNLVESCSSLPDSKMGEDCLRQIALKHNGLDADSIQLCFSLTFLDRAIPSGKPLVSPKATCVQ